MVSISRGDMKKLFVLLVSLFLAYGIFDLMSDGFPFNEWSNSAYHSYGWPVCFATSNSFLQPGFRVFSFDWFFLILDLAIMGMLLVSAVASLKRFFRTGLVVGIADSLLFVFSCSVLCAYIAVDLNSILPFLRTTLPNHSTSVGDWRELGQSYSLLGRVTFSLLIFLSSNQLGHVLAKWIARLLVLSTSRTRGGTL